MPIYEFECRDCGHRFSRRSSWAEKQSIRCPQCGSDRLKEIFGLNVICPSGQGGSAAGAACGGFG